MCSHYELNVPEREINREFEIEDIQDDFGYEQRLKIAPTQEVVIIVESGTRFIDICRWGLIPHWAKDLKSSKPLINARSESILEKPSFRDSFRERRCLIPASGFFEWKDVGTKKKQPYRFALKDKPLFAFAGIWTTWRKNTEDEIRSCSMLTTSANELVGQVHDRMPVIIPKAFYDEWLKDKVAPEELRKLLVPFDTKKMQMEEFDSVRWKVG